MHNCSNTVRLVNTCKWLTSELFLCLAKDYLSNFLQNCDCFNSSSTQFRTNKISAQAINGQPLVALSASETMDRKFKDHYQKIYRVIESLGLSNNAETFEDNYWPENLTNSRGQIYTRPFLRRRLTFWELRHWSSRNIQLSYSGMCCPAKRKVMTENLVQIAWTEFQNVTSKAHCLTKPFGN